MSQEDLVLDYMKSNKGITSMEAYDKLGVTRLSAVIFNLREHYDIKDVWESCINRYGTKVKFKRYIYNGKLKVDKFLYFKPWWKK